MIGLLFNADDVVAAWLFESHGQKPMKYDRALGLMNTSGVIVGAVLFHHYNGANVELSYYGKSTMTLGIVRCLARFILVEFDASRLTVVTSKRNRRYIKGFQKLGFKLEGVQRCYYGKRDCTRNTGVRFVMFRDRIEVLAKLEAPETKVA
jgi:RimJ/RimL family protein N-acetyltransferase